MLDVYRFSCFLMFSHFSVAPDPQKPAPARWRPAVVANQKSTRCS